MMKNCKDMENKISLYLDNALFAADRKAVEEHLKSCPQCGKALADLQKVKAITSKLSEVEPPPWFKQKIMAKVRAQAQKKSFAEKWFYPLRVKVPVQIFATIFIVVIAVYIYRVGNEQFKEVMPPAATAPMMKEQREQTPLKKDLPPKENEVAATRGIDAACDEKSCKIEGPVLYDRAEEVAASAKGKPEAPASPAPVQAKDKEFAADAGEMKSQALRASMGKGDSPISIKKDKVSIVLKAGDLTVAVAQVEKALVAQLAQNINREVSDKRVTFGAEISREKLKDLLAQLKTIGSVDEKGIVADSERESLLIVIIVIEINGN